MLEIEGKFEKKKGEVVAAPSHICDTFGHECEEKLRVLLPEMGISHKWASPSEDLHGVDCWITLPCGEVAVDFTVISPRNGDLLQQKVARALDRGIIPVVLEQGIITRAENGSLRAFEELRQEILLQIVLKLKGLKVARMTRELAAQIKQEKRGRA